MGQISGRALARPWPKKAASAVFGSPEKRYWMSCSRGVAEQPPPPPWRGDLEVWAGEMKWMARSTHHGHSFSNFLIGKWYSGKTFLTPNNTNMFHFWNDINYFLYYMFVLN